MQIVKSQLKPLVQIASILICATVTLAQDKPSAPIQEVRRKQLDLVVNIKDAAKLIGTWDLVIAESSGTVNMLFTVRQEGDALNGLIEFDKDHATLMTNITLSGSTFSGSFVDSDQNSGSMAGNVTGDRITGTIRSISPRKHTFKFTGTRATVAGTLSERRAEQNAPKPKIDSTYDKFQDRTTLVLDAGNLTTGGYDITNIIFVCNVQGQQTHGQAPSDCAIVVKQLSHGSWKFQSSRSLNLILDGKERMNLGQMLNMSEPHPITSDAVKEEVIVSVSLNAIIRMSAADKIEIQAGAVEFEMTDTQISALKTFIAYFN
jgi:hypothetical protein